MLSIPQPQGMNDEEIDAEVARLLDETPRLRAELEAEEHAIDSGDYVAIPHDQAMRTLGLDRSAATGPAASST